MVVHRGRVEQLGAATSGRARTRARGSAKERLERRCWTRSRTPSRQRKPLALGAAQLDAIKMHCTALRPCSSLARSARTQCRSSQSSMVPRTLCRRASSASSLPLRSKMCSYCAQLVVDSARLPSSTRKRERARERARTHLGEQLELLVGALGEAVQVLRAVVRRDAVACAVADEEGNAQVRLGGREGEDALRGREHGARVSEVRFAYMRAGARRESGREGGREGSAPARSPTRSRSAACRGTSAGRG